MMMIMVKMVMRKMMMMLVVKMIMKVMILMSKYFSDVGEFSLQYWTTVIKHLSNNL